MTTNSTVNHDNRNLKDKYELQSSFNLATNIDVEKWRSKETGLTVYLVKSLGPLVQGYIFIPTEADSHDGCPHTLEHLVFLGSEDYPYKGFLDQLSNRLFANGTNAWTSTDHTAYTLTCAGSEGFLQALPVFLDHVLYPVLTDHGFNTEVHHITGEGCDGGVVYCEMQEVEYKQSSLVLNEAAQQIYQSDCGYKYETGGKLFDIRGLKVETVREFHKKFYRPDNMGVLVVGTVDTEQVFKSIEPIEQKILKKGALPPMDKRPFSDNHILFDKDITAKIKFPSEDESVGDVYIAFKGADFHQHKLNDTLSILMSYLTQGPTSPLGREMIDNDDPYASSVSTLDIHHDVTMTYINFSNSSMDKIDLVKDKFLEVIRDIVKNKDFDLDRMRATIEQSKQYTTLQIEKSPDKILSDIIIRDYTYAKDPTRLKDLLDIVDIFNDLMEKDEEFWLDLIEKTFLQQPLATFIGIPSKEESKALREAEENREKQQIKELGPEKLSELGKQLEASKQYNDRPIDSKLLNQFKVPSPSSIKFFTVSSVHNDVARLQDEQHLALQNYITTSSSTKLPFQLQFDHAQSNFYQILLCFNTGNLPNHLRVYLPLYDELLFLSPWMQDGEFISHEDIDFNLLDCFISNSSQIGMGDLSQYQFLKFKFVKEKYLDAINLIVGTIRDLHMDLERVSIIAQQLYDEIPSKRNSGSTVNGVITHNYALSKKTNKAHMLFPRQFAFLGQLLKDIEEGDELKTKAHIDNLNEIKRIVFNDPANLFVQVAGNIYNLDQSVVKQVWVDKFAFMSTKADDTVPNPPSFHYQLLSDEILSGKGSSEMVVIPGCSSSFHSRVIHTGINYKNALSMENANLLVTCEYFDQMEGVFWKRLRGAGITYGFGLAPNSHSSTLAFSCSRSSDPAAAYKISKEIIEEAMKEDSKIDRDLFVSAKSSLLYSYAEKEQNIQKAMGQSFYNTLKGWPPYGIQQLMQLFSKVEEKDIKEATSKYLGKLFNDQQSFISFVGDNSKMEQLQQVIPNLKVILDIDGYCNE